MIPASVYTLAAPAPSFHESGPHSGPGFLSPTATPWPSAPWHEMQRSVKIVSPFERSSLLTGTSALAAIVFWPRHVGFFPIMDPLESHVMYAAIARTSFDAGVGSLCPSPLTAVSPPATRTPVAFSLRRKQSTMRSF